MNPPERAGVPATPQLVRGIGLLAATALNITNMVGVGPFITIPDFLEQMGGPQALVAWVAAAILIGCDGLVWSELGAALPASGGTYHFFREIFGRYRFGRLMPFLYIWQFLFSGALELASGYIGMGYYLEYMFGLRSSAAGASGGVSWIMAGACLVLTALLCRRIQVIGRLTVIFWAGSMATVLTVIVCGLVHFDASLLAPPANAFRLDVSFLGGLGGAMIIAIYDYFGYYNVCYLGDEVRDPARVLPRAVLLSVGIVAALYLTMNISIIAVVPWREAMASREIGALFMERLFGRGIAVAFTCMILWTGFACLFSMTLGYSRIPYAAARGGDFFRVFSRVHPRGRYPVVSLWFIGGLTAVFCFLPLQEVITAAVTLRILVQFVGQIVALHLLRTRRPDVVLPFRMKLYPLPSLVALAGWLYVFGCSGWRLIVAALLLTAVGCAVFFLREALREKLEPS